MMVESIHQKAMTLDTLLSGYVDPGDLGLCKNIEILGVAIDHREVCEGYLFVAVPGLSDHGFHHASDAIANGAAAILWDSPSGSLEKDTSALGDKISCVHCDRLTEKLGLIASRFFDNPSESLRVIGVTGTNGKTSITHFIAQCLDSKEHHCGLMGTLGNGYLDGLTVTGFTTADALQVQRHLRGFVNSGADHVVMEVSSHGLDQGRVKGVNFDTAVLSNFSQDHLDYHETLEAYAETKKSLFLIPELKRSVINLDDELGMEIVRSVDPGMEVWGYSTDPAVLDKHEGVNHYVIANSMRPTKDGFTLEVNTPHGQAAFSAHLLGQFNVYNVLATLAVLLAEDMPLDDAVIKLSKIRPVPGRMEIISVKGKPTVVVDYAHTPKGLEAACSAVKAHFGGKMWCVFGCGGDRDRTKRPQMAKVVERYADHIIVTSDNPRNEKPETIIEQIQGGFDSLENVSVDSDRSSAIETAVLQAGEDDVILLAGKGHESVQIIGDVRIEFDDRDVARKHLGVIS